MAREHTLIELCQACAQAPAIWLALLELAGGKVPSVVTPSRAELSKLTGILREKTISRALTALVKARWIKRRHATGTAADGNYFKLLRITLKRGCISSYGRGRFPPSTPTVSHSEEGGKRPITFTKVKALSLEMTPTSVISSSNCPIEGGSELRTEPSAPSTTPNGVVDEGQWNEPSVLAFLRQAVQNPQATLSSVACERRQASLRLEAEYEEAQGLEALRDAQRYAADNGLDTAQYHEFLARKQVPPPPRRGEET